MIELKTSLRAIQSHTLSKYLLFRRKGNTLHYCQKQLLDHVYTRLDKVGGISQLRIYMRIFFWEIFRSVEVKKIFTFFFSFRLRFSVATLL